VSMFPCYGASNIGARHCLILVSCHESYQLILAYFTLWIIFFFLWAIISFAGIDA
jgi:hypothetical protein